MAEKKRLGRTAKIVIAVVVVLIVFGAIGSGGNNGGSSSASSSSTGSTSEDSSAASSQASESADEVEFDALQQFFLTIDEGTTPADLKAAAEERGWAISSHDYTGSKTVVYSIGYDKDVAKDRYADSGPRISVSYNTETGEWKETDYTDDSLVVAHVYHTKFGTGISDPTAYDGYGFGERDSNNNVRFDSAEAALAAYVAKMNEQAAENASK